MNDLEMVNKKCCGNCWYWDFSALVCNITGSYSPKDNVCDKWHECE